MNHTFRQVDRDTLYLLPPSLNDWLPKGHLAHFVVEIVEQRDLISITAPYAGRGSKAHHPGDAVGAAVLRIRDRRFSQPHIGTWELQCFNH